MSEMKTFKVVCDHCDRPFHVRFPLADPEKEGSGEVGVLCMYCEKDVIVKLPRKYIEKEHLVRGIKSVPIDGGSS